MNKQTRCIYVGPSYDTSMGFVGYGCTGYYETHPFFGVLFIADGNEAVRFAVGVEDIYVSM